MFPENRLNLCKMKLKTFLFLFTALLTILSFFCSCYNEELPPVVKISRTGGTPISPFAFGNSYFNWVDFNNEGTAAIQGTEQLVRDLRLNIITGGNNYSDINTPQLFNDDQMDRYIEYCRAVGAEPMMIAPVYASNVDRDPTTAQGAADIVTYKTEPKDTE